VAAEEVIYEVVDASISTTFSSFSSQGHEAFNDFEAIRISSGADLMVFMHVTDQAGDAIFCSVGAELGASLQGNFKKEDFRGQLVSTVDVSNDCLGVSDLAGVFAFNMGIVPSRREDPEGGTFSFSAGYAVDDVFATRVANSSNLSASDFGDAIRLNRYSDPTQLCLGLPCGVDRQDTANGADAVFSLNATRFLIADLTLK